MRATKTLGKVSADLVSKLTKSGKLVFNLSDVKVLISKSDTAARNLVRKLIERGLVARLKPGKYILVPLEVTEPKGYIGDWFVAARELIQPHQYYISHYSALALHGMTTQPVLSVYITSPARVRDRKISEVPFKFIYCQPERFWGQTGHWVTKQEKVDVSDLERTVIDCLNRLDLSGGITEVAKGIWIRREDINYDKLVEYAEKFGKLSVVKRLGFLLALYKLIPEDTKNRFLKLIENSACYVPLDFTLPREGHYLAKWRLLLNVSREELERVAWT